MTNVKNLSRRDFLLQTAAAAGASSVSFSMAQQALAQTADKKRVIFWYVPEGCAQQAFWPADTGAVFINPDASIAGKKVESKGSSIRTYVDRDQASYCLQPLKEFEAELSLYSGFLNVGDVSKDDDHAKSVGGALTGGTPNEGSIDQILGSELQGDATLGAIYTAVYGHHSHDKGANDDYMSPVRKVGGGTTGSPIWNPVDTFKEVFGDGIPEPVGNPDGTIPYGDRHIKAELMRSMEMQLEQIKCVGGAEAGDKYQKLLASYQALETDMNALIAADEELAKQGGPQVTVDIPEGWMDNEGNRKDTSKYWNQHTNFEKMVDIAIDTTVAALALNRTRASTLQFSASGNDLQTVNHDHYMTVGIDLESGDVNDHYMSHEGADSVRRNQARIFRWYYSKLAELVRKLKAIPEGTGTLFDNTLIVACSEFGMRDHRRNDMPYLTIGSAGGAFKQGQYLDASSNGNFRDNGEFLYGIARGMGSNVDHVGTSNTAYSPMLNL